MTWHYKSTVFELGGYREARTLAGGIVSKADAVALREMRIADANLRDAGEVMDWRSPTTFACAFVSKRKLSAVEQEALYLRPV